MFEDLDRTKGRESARVMKSVRFLIFSHESKMVN
jgi:hypothetical protein